MEDTTETVAEYVDRMRRRRGLKWQQVASELGVSTQTLRRWSDAEWQAMRLDHAFALADLIPGLDFARLRVDDAA